MKVLLVYPEYPDTFWSFKYALKFISRKASSPPLGLLTVAAMLPRSWQKKLIDMSVTKLSDKDIKWADYVFISAMSVQRDSVKKVIERCHSLNTKIVAGGPLFTSEYEEFMDVDHLILNEAEITLPLFLHDLEKGNPKHIYISSERANIKQTPVPMWELLDMKKYASMSIQYSRGCPFDCEFCDITFLFGRKVRLKDKDQIINELESLYVQGWRGGVFIVDDNFVGNKRELKEKILPALIDWMEKRKYPFSFTTQASINISDDDELMRMMVMAGFDAVFVGIETPNEESLVECGKFQNKNHDLIASIKKIQHSGLEVQAGFIIGFDNDPPTIFNKIIEFIQNSGVVTAMVGLLIAPRGTKLYQRLLKEGRILKGFSGNNTSFSINFIPKMNYETLINGYKTVVHTIYSPKHYYERVLKFLRDFEPWGKKKFHIHFCHIKALFKSLIVLGIAARGRIYFWKLLFWTLFFRPRLLPLAVTYSIYGFHFRKVFKD